MKREVPAGGLKKHCVDGRTERQKTEDRDRGHAELLCGPRFLG